MEKNNSAYGVVTKNAPLSGGVAAENVRFMTKVYLWMTSGLCVSGALAYIIGNDPDLAEMIVYNRAIFYGLIFAQFGAVFFLSFAIQRINSWVAAMVFLLYAALTGATLSTVFMIYTKDSIVSIFGLTAFSFAGLSGFGYVTKRDLGPVGSFCVMGLWGMVGYGLLSLFFPGMMSGVANQVYSLVGVIVFSGLTAYDTQKIKEMNIIGNEGTDEDRKEAIFGALTLYLDFINLFLSLLRLFGRRK